MIGIVLVGHGSLAPAVLSSIESVLGHPVPGMVAVSAYAEDTLETLRERIAAAAASVEEGQGTIVLTDMYGDSATNVSVDLARDRPLRVVTGANLPIILKTISARHAMPVDALADFIVEYGREHIIIARPHGASRRSAKP